MRLFRNFLWKEWRDHRVVVLGILGAVPLLLLLARFALPEAIATDPVFVHVAAWGTLAIALLRSRENGMKGRWYSSFRFQSNLKLTLTRS